MVNEEKIKAFFNDEEKVKELASDEEFMKKVVNGEVTAEACKEEFEKFGLALSLEEAGEIIESTKKAMSISKEELDDVAAENIVGGSEAAEVFGALLAGGAVGTGLASVAYLVAGAYDHNRRYLDRSAKLAAAAGAMGVSSGIILSKQGVRGKKGESASNQPSNGANNYPYSPVQPSCPPYPY